jgi:DNA gyrase subunit A
VLNNLFKHTPMESVFGINMVALLDGQPKDLNLKEMLEAFVRHRREVVTRRTVYDLRKARERAHILEGQAIALANIDAVIAVIKASPTPPEAKVALMARMWSPGAVPEMLARAGAVVTRPDDLADEFGLQAGRLSAVGRAGAGDPRNAPEPPDRAGAGQDRREFQELLVQIRDLSDILARPERLLAVIRAELEDIRAKYATSAAPRSSRTTPT